MNDCVNAEIRDQLPDLVHERLDAAARARVLAHVDACADCRAELDVLRSTRAMLVARTPRIDLQFIVEALPKPATRSTRSGARRRVWADWRVAAAVTLLVAGGTSVAVLNRAPSAANSVAVAPTSQSAATASTAPVESIPLAHDSAPVASAAAPSAQEQVAATNARVAAAEPASTDAPATTDAGARLGDLNEQQLQSLLKDIDQLQPVPVTEPDPVTLRVTTTSSSEGA
ncbi:MAG TPA: zf-HC2 domain-containing protein [Gemmatimonadaceae bacterium]|nr:zf-HC2 domain-containing protein [Gemmatimonadaceae bacterium]